MQKVGPAALGVALSGVAVMTFLDAQLKYLQACRAYEKHGTELARQQMLAAAREVEQVFEANFPLGPAPLATRRAS